MTRRSILNLSAFAIIAGGGGMLLTARPAAAAPTAYSELCDKMLKRIETQAAQCEAAGGSYWVDFSCSGNSATLISGCV